MLLTDFVDKTWRRYSARAHKPKTRAEYGRLLEKLILPRFGGVHLKNIKRKAVAEFYDRIAGDAPTQANRALALLSGILTLAMDRELIESNPASRIRRAKESTREVYLTGGQIKALMFLLPTLSPGDSSFLRAMIHTGARPGELAQCRRSYIKGDTIRLPDSKTGKRTIYLSEAAQAAISAAPGDDLLWPDLGSPTKLWDRVRRRAQGTLDDVRLYDLRHTFASAGLNAGLPIEAMSQLLGHSDPRTTRRYMHLMPETGVKAVGAVQGALSEMLQ